MDGDKKGQESKKGLLETEGRNGDGSQACGSHVPDCSALKR